MSLCLGHGSVSKERSEASKELVRWISGSSFPCGVCGIVYSSSDDLKTHQKFHRTGLAEYCCEICSIVFVSFELLHSHMFQLHKQQFKHVCCDCGRGFNCYTSFNNHNRLFHRPDLQCPVCDICKKIFPFESNLRQHSIKHSGLRGFPCDRCGKSFKYKHTLRDHREHACSVLSVDITNSN